MVNKKKIISIFIILGLVAVSLVYFFLSEDKKTSLTVAEKRWIEHNKNKVIDFAVLNNVPVINDNGNGILFDFLNSLEEDTGLEFNELLYTKGDEVTASYALEVDSKKENSIDFYTDNYVIVTKKKMFFSDVTELNGLTIGVLNDDLSKVSKFLMGSVNLTYKDYTNETLMINDVIDGNVDGVVLPKLDYMESVLKNDLSIAYNIDEYTKKYSITLGDNNRLNKILTKYFKNYKNRKYDNSFNKYFSDSYFTYKGVDDKEQVNFRSKRYSYGFVLNAPYEFNINNSLIGFNYSLINKFSKMANVEIDFKRYSSLKNELNDFNSNNLDFIFGDINSPGYKMDVYSTVPAYKNKVAIVTKNRYDLDVNNVSSLSGVTVLSVEDSKTEAYLKDNGVKVKTYKTVSDLLNNLDGDKVGVIDDFTYDYYVRKDYKDIVKLSTLDFNNNFGFVSRNIGDNKVFNEFFDFYLSFIDTNKIKNESYNSILSSNNNIKIIQVVLSTLVLVFTSFSLVFVFKLFKGRKKYNFKLSKTDKLRYIDSLTSLKNRNYLNDNIANWDASEVYPQSIVVVDLNNIAYINDNFGHAEGDKVISEAAGVLINSQLSDSEIIRTNGNEFLIFTVGYDEKEIVTYIRKLNKKFKELSHGFGAAIGYSMINDEIKTIDDAINEATIDMRNNKEEVSS